MFETPIFLLAALIGGMLPLLLHMMQKRRATPVYFPTLRFMKAAQKSASRSIRIEHLLLWLLRTAIMVIFGVAFALPVLRTGGGGILGRAPRDVAIVIDTSYSMNYQTGRETVFEHTLNIATDLINGLGESDRFCIYLAGDRPQALISEPIGDRDAGLAQIKSLRPGHTASRLLPAIAAAREALDKTAGRRQLEMHVLTDNQALAWKKPETAAGEKQTEQTGAKADRLLSIFVTLAGIPAPENITPQTIELTPPILFQGSGSRLTVRLDQTGPPRETTVTFFINDSENARRLVTTGTPDARQLIFAVPPLPPGTHTARVEVPTDNLSTDDAFHFLIRVRDRMPTLVVGGQNDTFFLRAALRASIGGHDAFTFVAPEALGSEKLGDYASIFLCNALPLPGQTVTAIERFVQRGGMLVIFPGARASVRDYAAWQCLPGTVQETRNIARAEARQMMIWNAPSHPILQTLGDALADPLIAVQRLLVWGNIESATTVLAALSSGVPLLMERTFGEGRVLMFGLSADRIGSNFPLTPFFMPMVAQIVEYGGGLGGVAPFIWGQEQLSLDPILPESTTESSVRLYGPQGQVLPVRSMLREGQTALYLENALEPGIYKVDRQGTPQAVLAVNMPREESDLTPLEPETITDLLDPQTVYIAEDRESLAKLIQEHRVGRTYGELLLWVLMALMVTEFLYANRLARARGLLSEQLTIDPSGRVSGHIKAATEDGGDS